MTLYELSRVTQCPIKVKDAKDGRVLCYSYKPEKHQSLFSREVCAVWAEFDVLNSGFSSRAKANICVFISHEGSDTQ